MKKMMLVSMAAAVWSAVVGCTSGQTLADTAGVESMLVASASTQHSVVLTDISSHWAGDSIRQAVTKGYVDGYQDGTFHPDQTVTRAEFMKMLVVATGTKLGNQGAHWYDAYFSAVSDAGIYHTDDFPAGELDQQLTRVEMAKLSVRFVEPDSRSKYAQYYDTSVMYKAAKLGVIQGLGGGELGPGENTTRAQSVTIIERISAISKGEKLPVDKYAVGNAELALIKTNMFTVAPEIFGYPQYVKWDPANLFIESDDGNYKGVIDSLVVIDMADPNDPHRGLLGDVNELHWYTGSDEPIKPLIKDYPDSYVMVVTMHNEVNIEPEKYVGRVPSVSIGGIVSPDEAAFGKGTLNDLTPIYKNRPGDFLNSYIIPKKGLYSRSGYVLLQIKVPTRESLPKVKRIFGMNVPKNFP